MPYNLPYINTYTLFEDPGFYMVSWNPNFQRSLQLTSKRKVLFLAGDEFSLHLRMSYGQYYGLAKRT